jgi:S1-C subfamily serine protease
MPQLWLLAALLGLAGAASGQTPSVLHIKMTVVDAAGTPMPVSRHTLLISDNPATSEPRRVLTAADGTVDVKLRPGSYTVESDRPFVFAGSGYLWTEVVDVAAGRETMLELTAGNAEVTALTADSPAERAAGPEGDASVLLAKWQASIVSVWSPTSRGTGFLLDARGLIATHRSAVGEATSVEVQLSPTMKVPGRVLPPGSSRDVAIVRVDPGVVTAVTPIPLPCAAAGPPLDDGHEIVAIAAPLRRATDVESGEVTALQPRAVETDLRLSFGGAGGPVFNEGGVLVGLTSLPADADAKRRTDVTVVRTGIICEAVSAAMQQLSAAPPPKPTTLPVEPTRPYPAAALEASAKERAGPVTAQVVASADFDIALITPSTVYRGRLRSDWTGGRDPRSPETEARLGQITDFGDWSDYFADTPPVLIVRVTPKLVEGFWKRLAREAARTQGAVLPPLKDFKTNFVRMRASCGTTDVTPIHPFVLEHRLSGKDVIREGMYVFPLEAFGPQCGGVTLSLYSERAPETPDTVTVDPKVTDQIWQDVEPYRAAGGR